ncbi:GNAT family N-acetyltransferase [Brevibacillus borstelensis]|uniref:GNAT family N-acetyltransferase n=1 Tax=Brevibacillus borstelensis TaxID=45462 RepID=UPI0020A34955|nr:GNAT family N-acetyltransferase [Brevibacillus borstelensis]
MNRPWLKLSLIESNEERKAYRSLLLLADDWAEAVDQYMYEGELYIAQDQQDQVLGVCLMHALSPEEAEIKNLAVRPEFRGQGVGKAIIEELCSRFASKGFSRIIVGTANSSIDNLAFYRAFCKIHFLIRRDKFEGVLA